MSGRLERDIEEEVTEYAVDKLNMLAMRLNIVGRKGWPDHGYGYKGRACYMEFKRPGETPEPLQKHVHRLMREQGFYVFVVDNADYGKAVLEAWKQYVDKELEAIRESNDRNPRSGPHLRFLVRGKDTPG